MHGDPAVLRDALSRPPGALVESLARTSGDILLLGAGGQIGPSLAVMARRALDAAGSTAKVIGVARNLDEQPTALLSNAARAAALFGYPAVPLARLLDLTAAWVLAGGPVHGKPTGFQQRGGTF